MGSVVMVAILLSSAAAQTPGAAAPEMVRIDGSTRPELVPQWSVWGYVFRVLAGGPRQLPTSVRRLVSSEEEALLLKAADAAQKADTACQSRLSAVITKRAGAPASVVDARLQEITVACRRETLRTRDRLLTRLNPEAAAALTAFAESTKDGTSISVPKRNLSRFLEPE